MSRLAMLTALLVAVSLTANAEAGRKKGGPSFQIGGPGGPQITLPGGPGFKPGGGFKPPVIRPPVICPKPPVLPPVRPPVFPPVRPPIVCPKPPIVIPPPRPPIVCPPRPPIVLPPPVVFPKPPIVLPPTPPVVVCPPKPPVILPPPVICEKPPVVCPPTHGTYRFGMSLQLVQTHYGVGMQVVSVDLTGPAAAAGLRPGHVLLAANNQSLATVQTNEQAAALLQALVASGQPAGTLALTVLDASTNQMSLVNMTPEIVGAPAPAASAPIALNPGQPTATL